MQLPSTSPTAVVIGAGPAGSVASILLARAGFQVHLVEQSTFPRDKVCGECLSALGWAALQRYGVADALLRAGTITLHQCVCHASSGERVELKLPNSMYGISRANMDTVLLQESHRAGANIHQPARCESVCENGILRIHALKTATEYSIAADVVLVSDGKGKFSREPCPPTGDFGIKAHFSNVDAPADMIQLFAVRSGYGGVAPIEHGAFNCSFSVPRPRLRQCRGDLDALFQELCNENLALERAMKHATRTSPWLTCPLPRSEPHPATSGRILALGNACASIEPIGGEGMGLAIRSAEIVALELIAVRNQRRAFNYSRVRTELRALWNRRSLLCRAMAKVMSDSLAASTLITLGRDSPALQRLSLWLIGK